MSTFRLRMLGAMLAALPALASDAAVAQRRAPADVDIMPKTANTTALELAERKAVADGVMAAVSKQDFAALATMAKTYRTADLQTASGVWKLNLFYANAVYYLQPDFQPGSCAFIASPLIEQWEQAAPRSPAPVIIKAKMLLRQAWCFRGNGPGRSVEEAAWVKFHEGVAAAYRILKDHERVASTDPEFFPVMEEIYQLQGRDKAEFHNLLVVASRQFPYYYPIYFQAYEYYRPQWFGSTAEIDELARFAATQTSKRDGLGTYARVYWHITNCNCRANMADMDWPTMKTAMTDVMTRYPSDWNTSNFAKIACRQGDGATAARLMAAIPADDSAAWAEKIEWVACQSLVKRSQPIDR